MPNSPTTPPTLSAIIHVLIGILAKKKPQKAPPPFNGAGKNKRAYQQALCLQPVCFTHSNVRYAARSSQPRSLISFRLLHQLQQPTCKCFVPHTHTFPTHKTASSLIFTCELFAPWTPPLSLIISALFSFVCNPSCYWNENNSPRTAQVKLFPIPTAQHHHPRNLAFPIF